MREDFELAKEELNKIGIAQVCRDFYIEPKLKGFVIALQRLFTWLGKVFKVDLSNLMPKGGGGGSGFDSLIGGADDLEDSVNKATKEVDKLKTHVLGIDELNIVEPDKGGGAGSRGAGGIGSGLLDEAFDQAFEEYQTAWDAAFANVESRAQEIADKIQAFFKNLFKPVTTAWNTEGVHVMGSWERALGSVGQLVKDIGRDFMTMWQQQGTVSIFEDIFHTIEDIGSVVGNLAENFGTAWNTNEVGLHIFENIRDVVGAITGNIRKAADYTVQWSKTLDFYPILSSIQEWTKSLVPVFDALSGMVSDFYTQALLPLGKWTIEEGLPDLLDTVTNLNKSIDWEQIRESLSGLNNELVNISKFTFTGITDFIDNFLVPIAAWTMNDAIPTLVDAVTDFSSKIEWETLNENLGKFWEGLSRFTTNVGDGLIQFFNSVSPFLTSVLAETINGIGTALGTPGEPLNNISAESVQAFGTTFTEMISLAYQAVDGLGIAYATNEEVRESFSQAASAISEGLQPALEFVTSTVLPDLNNGWGKLMQVLSPLTEFLSGMFVSIWQDMINPALKYVGETVLPKVTSTFENLWNNVLVPLGNFLASVLTPVIQIVSDVLTMLWQNIVVPLADAIGNILGAAFEGLITIFDETLIPAWNFLIETIQFFWNEVLSPIVSFLWEIFKPAFEETFAAIGKIVDNISKIFQGLIDFIVGIFTGDWKKAWEGVKKIFSGIWDNLGVVVKIPMNAVIAVFEGLANKVIDAWNWIKSSINSISIEVPDWLGGGTVGFDLAMSDHINIPRFAKGGITLSHTFAEIGELNKPEAILPLSDTRAMGMIADSIMDNADYNYNGNGGVLEGSQIEEAVRKGVRDAVAEILAPYLADIVQNTRESADKDMVAVMDTRAALADLRAEARREGYVFRG